MSFAKYAQFYKDNGFFAGSKIKATVTDNSFIGQEMVLSKGTDVIQTRTIPVSGLVEFFTDESGELTLSSDNGTSTISGSVEVTSYATYNVTLNGASSDNERKAYANDVTMNSETAVANISYTGDVSRISAVASDPSLVSLSISGNKITLRDAGNDKSGKCSITATIASTSEYDSAEVSFNVNKLTGTGSWEDAPDDTIASMIAKADKGEINLSDFWNVGDTRRVSIDAIGKGDSVITNQPSQEVDLVLMHLSVADAKYMLTNPTEGNRQHPSFVVGLKDCLQNLSYISYVTKSITLTTSSYEPVTISFAMPFVNDDKSELEKWLNENFYGALPQYIQNALKTVNVRHCGIAIGAQTGSGAAIANGTVNGTKTLKVSLPSTYEVLADTVTVEMSNEYLKVVGSTLFQQANSAYIRTSNNFAYNAANRTMNTNYEGSLFDYFSDKDNRMKKRGVDGENVPYLTRSYGGFGACNFYSSTQKYQATAKRNGIITADGTAGNFNNESADTRNISRGISPIMFI